jgi:hypothetical protein
MKKQLAFLSENFTQVLHGKTSERTLTFNKKIYEVGEDTTEEDTLKVLQKILSDEKIQIFVGQDMSPFVPQVLHHLLGESVRNTNLVAALMLKAVDGDDKSCFTIDLKNRINMVVADAKAIKGVSFDEQGEVEEEKEEGEGIGDNDVQIATCTLEEKFEVAKGSTLAISENLVENGTVKTIAVTPKKMYDLDEENSIYTFKKMGKVNVLITLVDGVKFASEITVLEEIKEEIATPTCSLPDGIEKTVGEKMIINQDVITNGTISALDVEGIFDLDEETSEYTFTEAGEVEVKITLETGEVFETNITVLPTE